MKYQKPLAIVGGIVVVGALLYWVRQSLIEAGNNDTRGVTSTATAGQAQEGATKTTPIQGSKVAFAAPSSTLSLLVNSGVRLARTAISSVLPVTNDRLKPYGGNAASTASADKAPVRPDYRQSAYSLLKPR